MAISLLAASIRHERRVRLTFSNALASSAFTSTAYYSVASVDGTTTPPTVVRTYALADSPNVVELQLGADLVQGGGYLFSANGVPAVDASTTPTPSTEGARMGREQGPAALGVRRRGTALEEVLYGRDLRWTGTDFGEAPSGDLADVTGLEVLETDLQRRMDSDGLQWDPSFGLKARQFVDAPSVTLPALRARAVAQARLDDRVAEVVATVDDADPSEPVVDITAVPVGSSLAGDSIRVRTTLS